MIRIVIMIQIVDIITSSDLFIFILRLDYDTLGSVISYQQDIQQSPLSL